MKVVAIIQARMGSTRLPGKVLMDLAGEPMLARVYERAARAKSVDKVIVATSDIAGDDSIAELCSARAWLCFRGSENDVLDRYYQAAKIHRADIVVRITADCPLIEPLIIDKVIKAFLERNPKIDYASNILLKRTFPRGLDTEVLRFDTLERIWKEDQDLPRREHVTAYIHQQPELFNIYGVVNYKDYSYMRWTVDTIEDLNFVRKVYKYFHSNNFNWKDVLSLLEKHSEWLEINRHIKQKIIK